MDDAIRGHLVLHDERIIPLNARELRPGFELARFKEIAGQSFESACGETARALTRQGLLEVTRTHVRCTDEGLLMLDRVVLELANGATSGAAK